MNEREVMPLSSLALTHRLGVAGFGWVLLGGLAQAQTIPVVELTAAPVLDGRDEEWRGTAAHRVALHSNHPEYHPEQREVLIRAGRYGGAVFFYLEWQDDQKERAHKPYLWNESRGKYERGPQREDRLAMQFQMRGHYTTDWLVGQDFVADMWHWKSTRSNPLGIAHDKLTEVSRHPLLRAFKAEGPNGAVYLLRQSDSGAQPYTTRRYRQKARPVMPKYVLNPEVQGSVADVQARGRWAEGRWHLELKRKLDTGHEDDVRFVPGRAVPGGIAVFDRSESTQHAISDTLLFQF